MTVGFMSDAHLTNARKMFLLDCQAGNLSSKTMHGYSGVLDRFVEFTGDITVKELTPDHVRMYIAYLADQPGRYDENEGKFSSHSLAKHYAVVRTWIRWMYAQKMLDERITDHVKPPRLSKRLPSTLTDEEVRSLFDLLKRENRTRDHLIFSIWYDTGLRLKEMSDLNIDSISIDGGWLKVIGKGDKEDIVPIGAAVCRDLYTYINVHRKPAIPHEKALFLAEQGPNKGYALGYEGLSLMARRTLSKIRSKGKRGAHVMRHTAATEMIRGGASVEHVRRILRHTDSRITQAYLHLANDDLLLAHREASPMDRHRTRRPRRR